MNETWATLQGWVGTDVIARDTPYGTVTSFRIGCTPRFMRNGQWSNGTTSWYTVNAWRTLGDNVARCVQKGDAVVVHGRMRLDTWRRTEGEPETTRAIIEATFVGHDMNRGTSVFARSAKTDRTEQVDDQVREMMDSFEPGGPQLDQEGRPIGGATAA
ncbi:MAG TPA: single-stranded DNA-binding protein [Marmoricola sp.]|nr:single-stranded DNA-binding protein [Marmoricola sp.]